MANSLRAIESAQGAWAPSDRRDPRRDGYAFSIEANLYLGRLTAATKAEFSAADGSELEDTDTRPAKMRAFASSSALAVNFFDAWRDRPKDPLGPALGLGAPVSALRFEYVCKSYPVGPRSPNLDLLLELADGTCVAVESKFGEPFRSPGKARSLSPKYLLPAAPLWALRGMANAQRLAESLASRWTFLDAAQLLKHLLGLSHDGCASSLMYLWYDTGLDDAKRHRDELIQFADALNGEGIEFRATTYQEVFEVVRESSSADPAWASYMAARYFS